jgi:CubicO group peptidase (beta-lactamase class C family)
MEQQATWILSKTGQGDQRLLHAGRHARLCALMASSSPNGARVNGQSHRARRLAGRGHHRAHVWASASPGRGYGYQWWTYDDGTFAARGIFGQGIFIDPQRKLVIVSNANWAGGASRPGGQRSA